MAGGGALGLYRLGLGVLFGEMLLLASLFLCPVASVHDGDTLTCAGGTRVRLAGIDAPEIGPCRGRRGRVCAPGDGQASRRALVALVAGQTLRCEANGTSYRRITAWCSAGGRDLSCAMIHEGAAVWWPRYDPRRRLAGCSH